MSAKPGAEEGGDTPRVTREPDALIPWFGKGARSQHQLLSPKREKKASVEERSVLTGTRRALCSAGRICALEHLDTAGSSLLFFLVVLSRSCATTEGSCQARERKLFAKRLKDEREDKRTSPKERREER